MFAFFTCSAERGSRAFGPNVGPCRGKIRPSLGVTLQDPPQYCSQVRRNLNVRGCDSQAQAPHARQGSACSHPGRLTGRCLGSAMPRAPEFAGRWLHRSVHRGHSTLPHTSSASPSEHMAREPKKAREWTRQAVQSNATVGAREDSGHPADVDRIDCNKGRLGSSRAAIGMEHSLASRSSNRVLPGHVDAERGPDGWVRVGDHQMTVGDGRRRTGDGRGKGRWTHSAAGIPGASAR